MFGTPFGGGGLFNGFFSLFPIFFVLIFGIVIVGFVFVFVRGITQWSKNNKSPVLTVGAKVVSKRQHVSHSMNNVGAGGQMTSSGSSFTSYYATFEVESGDRMELAVPSDEIGLIAEGDTGKLTFQGTRYKGFVREI